MIQRNKLKIHRLHKRPQHPILLQRGPIRAVQFILWAGAFHDGHGAEEAEEVCGSEDGLVCGDAGRDGGVFAAELDAVLQEFEPGCCCGAEDGCIRGKRGGCQRSLLVVRVCVYVCT